MSAQLHHITVDCRDAAAQARFWAAVLDLRVGPRADREFAALASERDGEPGWLFFAVPEGKSAKNRLHLDLRTPDLDAETERLTGLGAQVLHEKEEWGAHWRTLADPEGNEFCLVEVPADLP